jgi:hypothetical protein
VKFIYLSTAIANESEVLKQQYANHFEIMIVNFYNALALNNLIKKKETTSFLVSPLETNDFLSRFLPFCD